jgi:methionyl-tRNA synthetase
MSNRFYLTTPIYYVNDVPHVGTSYTTVAADILARFHRLRGEEVLLVTGTDENATKVVQAAEKAGMEPGPFVDQMAERFQNAWRELNVEYDVFIRTSEPRHRRAVEQFFRAVRENGDIYEGQYEGWYCVNCETYFSDDEAKEVDGVRSCPNIPQHPPLKRVSETNYFFALSKYGQRLLDYYQTHPEFLQPESRRNEVVAFVEQGLRDVCITRAATGWGIPVPDDPSQVVYVWFDALINYLTVAGYPDDPEALAKWWPANLHLVGKDIYVRFHCTLWPAMLMAAGLPLPQQVFGHGFWMSEGVRMSKTLKNFVEPLRLAEWLAELSGAKPKIAVDAIRYFLFREMPFGEDGNFARAALLGRFNSDLANDLGNVLNRSLSLTFQNFEGLIPAAGSEETRLRDLATEKEPAVSAALERNDLQGALSTIWEYVGAINKYLDDRAPWALAKAGKREELGGVLYHALEAARVVTVWITPFMPCVSEEMRRQLGLSLAPNWEQGTQWGLLETGSALAQPAPIFPRIDRKTMQEALTKAAEEAAATAAAAAQAAAPTQPAEKPTKTTEVTVEATPEITIDDFAKVELRVAEVLSAERIPKSDKLLNLRVSLGNEERTVLAGMAEYYEPETLIGRKVVMIVNLAPRKMRGLVSQGMLLAAEEGDQVCLLQPDADIPAGAKIR